MILIISITGFRYIGDAVVVDLHIGTKGKELSMCIPIDVSKTKAEIKTDVLAKITSALLDQGISVVATDTIKFGDIL